jgi:hypothetical protein
VYFAKGKKHAIVTVTAADAAVTGLTSRTENVEHGQFLLIS